MVNVKVTWFFDVMKFPYVDRYVTPFLKKLCTQLNKATLPKYHNICGYSDVVLLPYRLHLLKLHCFETRVPKIGMAQRVFQVLREEWLECTGRGIKLA